MFQGLNGTISICKHIKLSSNVIFLPLAPVDITCHLKGNPNKERKKSVSKVLNEENCYQKAFWKSKLFSLHIDNMILLPELHGFHKFHITCSTKTKEDKTQIHK